MCGRSQEQALVAYKSGKMLHGIATENMWPCGFGGFDNLSSCSVGRIGNVFLCVAHMGTFPLVKVALWYCCTFITKTSHPAQEEREAVTGLYITGNYCTETRFQTGLYHRSGRNT